MKKKNTKRKRKIVWNKKAMLPLLILVVFPTLYILKLTHPSLLSFSNEKGEIRKKIPREIRRAPSPELRTFQVELMGLLKKFKIEFKECEAAFNDVNSLIGLTTDEDFIDDEKRVNLFLDKFDKRTLNPITIGKIYLMFENDLIEEMDRSWLSIIFKELKPCKAKEKGRVIRLLSKGFASDKWSKRTKEKTKRVVKNYFLKELKDERPLNVLKAYLMEIVLVIHLGLFEKKGGVELAKINLDANEKGLVVMKKILTHIKGSSMVPVDVIRYERRESKKLRIQILNYVKNLQFKKENK